MDENHAPSFMSPATSIFSRLSVDVFNIIASSLRLCDIKFARLANRELNSFLSPFLFRSIRFTPYKSLYGIDTISEQPDLSNIVRTLIYEPMYKRAIADDEFEVLNCKGENVINYMHNIPSCSIPLGFNTWWNVEHFKMMLDYQAQDESKLLLHLKRILKAFPKISTIRISDTSSRNISKDARIPIVWRDAKLPYRWIRPEQLLALIQAIDITGLHITVIDTVGYQVKKKWVYLDDDDFWDDSHIPGSIKYCLQRNHIGPYYEKELKPFIPVSAFDLNTSDLNITKRVFSNLTTLNLSIFTLVPLEYFDTDPHNVPSQYWGNLPQVLQSLPKISDLSLDFGVRRLVDQQLECYYYHDDLAELFEDLQATFSQLKSLRLAHFRARGTSFNSLLQRHPQIENLRVKFAIDVTLPMAYENSSLPYHLAKPEWLEVLQTMRSMRLQRLELCGIEGFFFQYYRYGSVDENLTLNKIHDYILHGYGDNPLLPDQMGVIGGNTTLEWDRELWWD